MSTQETNLKAIADAIRAKTGETGTIVANDFAEKIAAIQTGVAKPKWVQSTLPIRDLWSSVCYGNGKFVAIDGYESFNNKAAYSTDVINWTQSTMTSHLPWRSVCYGNGKFVAVAYNSSIAAYSTDGINWTRINLPGSRYWTSVCYGNGKFVAIAYNSTYAAYLKDSFDEWG